jgi:hypothetical protein
VLAVVIAEGVAIALLAVLVLGLLRSHALILRALHELGAGPELEKDAGAGAGAAPAPGPVAVQIEPGVVPATRAGSSRALDVVGEDLRGRPAHVELAGAGSGATLLAFLTSGCSVCLTFWEEFGPDTETPGDSRLVVVAKGSAEDSPATLAKLARPGLEVVASSGAWVDYDIPGSPYFVLVEDGVVTGEGSATNWPSVRDLLQQAVHDSAHARAAAGRTGPGGDSAAVLGTGNAAVGGRDDLSRIDSELAAAGIHPGHHSLFEPADPVDDDEATGR